MNYALENLLEDKMHFQRGLRGQDSLLHVRHLPNGRIDFLSIDEMARLLANQVYQMRNMDFDKMALDSKARKTT